MNIIALAGYAGSGKTTIARVLAKMIQPRPQILSFAGVLKEKIAEALDVGLDYIDANKPMIRPLLVELGRTGRKVKPTMWIDYLDAYRNRDTTTLIDDCRYANEAHYVLGAGGIVVYIIRPGAHPANDEEDTSIAELLRLYDPPYIANVRTPEIAAAMILELVKAKL